MHFGAERRGFGNVFNKSWRFTYGKKLPRYLSHFNHRNDVYLYSHEEKADGVYSLLLISVFGAFWVHSHELRSLLKNKRPKLYRLIPSLLTTVQDRFVINLFYKSRFISTHANASTVTSPALHLSGGKSVNYRVLYGR